MNATNWAGATDARRRKRLEQVQRDRIAGRKPTCQVRKTKIKNQLTNAKTTSTLGVLEPSRTAQFWDKGPPDFVFDGEHDRAASHGLCFRMTRQERFGIQSAHTYSVQRVPQSQDHREGSDRVRQFLTRFGFESGVTTSMCSE